MMKEILHFLERSWQLKLFTVGEKDIFLSNSVIALVMLLLGFALARIISKMIVRLFKKRLGLAVSTEATLSSILYYILLVIFVFFALNISNIPLTVFTFVGGAVALGVGFGSQNIIKNFISGLILLVERPISVGDIVEVGGLVGTVDKIGGRSTNIITPDNIDVIVPNSSFLESNVVNWTLRDQRMRKKINVGVAYGSDTKKVKDILENVANVHPDVLKDTIAPFALFTNFGDSALEFELYYWVWMQSIKGVRIIESELRFAIDQAFRDEGITIPFPQRDVHLYEHTKKNG
ncbi:MAG: mechanosensitive ion channel [Bdellovibrionota bacterium]